MNYLFAVVLKHHLDTVENIDASLDWLSNPPSKSEVAVLFHLDGECSKEVDLIAEAKAANPELIVLALHSDNPELGVQAFVAGADDVVGWPCSLHELAVRLFVRMGHSLGQELLPAGDTSWETEAYIADRAGLTRTEAQVMRVLYNQDGKIVSRDSLSLAVDGRPWQYGDRKFDVYVAKIRKKLLDSFGTKVSVSTIRSSGYCLVTEGSDIFGEV